jgi:maleylacetoacetate isomerase
MRLYRIPFSTNVERVTLALAFKGLEAEAVDVDPADRSVVRELSGQELVPVLDVDGEIVVDSTVILRRLEELHPEPPLFPRESARRAELDVFLDWFNRVWKRFPNEIEAELVDHATNPDRARIEALGEELQASLDLFEAMLDGRDHLFGDFSAADCAAFPFLKYALGMDPADDELFHRILVDNLHLDGHRRVEAWIRRVDGRPRSPA